MKPRIKRYGRGWRCYDGFSSWSGETPKASYERMIEYYKGMQNNVYLTQAENRYQSIGPPPQPIAENSYWWKGLWR